MVLIAPAPKDTNSLMGVILAKMQKLNKFGLFGALFRGFPTFCAIPANVSDIVHCMECRRTSEKVGKGRKSDES